MIKNRDIEINFYYSSLQLRANNTLKIIQKVLNEKKSFTRAWQLNERHYGELTGLNKIKMGKKIGEEKVHQYRRSWSLRPDPLSKESEFHPANINNYPKAKKIMKDWVKKSAKIQKDFEDFLKVKDLKQNCDPGKFDVMCQIKNAIDPLALLNPGVILRQHSQDT